MTDVQVCKLLFSTSRFSQSNTDLIEPRYGDSISYTSAIYIAGAITANNRIYFILPLNKHLSNVPTITFDTFSIRYGSGTNSDISIGPSSFTIEEISILDGIGLRIYLSKSDYWVSSSVSNCPVCVSFTGTIIFT